MFLKKIIPFSLKQYLIRIRINIKYHIKIGRKCILDLHTYYEGHNTLQDNVRIGRCNIGHGTYIANGSMIAGAKIGRFCAIGSNVRTGLGAHPTKDFVSINPSFYSLTSQTDLSFSKKQYFQEHKYVDDENMYFCEIGNDVWIGNNVMIMDGVTIGDGAIIAAGAIVMKDIAPYSIVGGIPAKEIRKRFTDEQIQKLLKIQWWNWSLEVLHERAPDFNNINEFVNKYKS